MDENSINQTTYEYDVTEDMEIQETDIPLEDVQQDVLIEEDAYEIQIEQEETAEIDISESMGWVGGDNRYHDSLLGIDFPRQHPITSITDLREELDEIERLKTVCSDKFNLANYYEWNDAAYDEYGYFVSLVPGSSKIQICNGTDIFGVSVDVAGFVGGQDETIPRDESYGLIATSGLVYVRCELGVEVGDYVISNAYGRAMKSPSNYGYRVISKENKNGTEYAVIVLGVQADITNAIGNELGNIEKRVGVNETNIVAAINVANQAYNKSIEASESSSVSEEAVKRALESVLGVEEDVEEMYKNFESVSNTSAQAKAIAESAATSAESMKNEAIAEANKALDETSKLRDEFALMDEGITEIENQISIIVTDNSEQGTAIAGIRTDVTDHDTKINSLVSWQGDTNTAMARIEQKADANGAYIQSTVANMDKYSVGPHSQADGFTLEQAASVLEEGVIYVPTESVEEEYEYVDTDEKTQTYKRTFTPQYLYKWGKVNEQYRWITVDKNYTETSETNTSSKAVYFTTTEPVVSGNFGYWYTNGDTITGSTGTYEPHTLYKWDSYVDENNTTKYHWVAVATLAGNASNRAVSQIRQDANNIELRVTNTEGSAASSKQWIDENSANIQDVVSWKSDNGESLVTFMQTADENFASASQVAQIVDKDGNINAASIVTAVNESESSVVIEADHIEFNGQKLNIKVDATNIDGELTIGQLPSTVAEKDDIPTKTSDLTNDSGFQNESGVVTIAKGAINADHIKTLNLEVGNEIVMGDNATISWNNVTEKDEVATTTDVNDAKTEAINAASSDATTKADSAKSEAVNEVKGLGYQTSDQVTTITRNEISTATIRADQVLVDGDLMAFGATIGGWKITDGMISDDTETVGLCSGDTPQYESLVKKDGNSPIRVYAGERVVEETQTPGEYSFDDGVVNIKISSTSEKPNSLYGTVIVKQIGYDGEFDDNSTLEVSDYTHSINDDGSVNIYFDYDYALSPNGIEVTFQYMVNDKKFMVLEDGSLYAEAASIHGNIKSTSGEISGFTLSEGQMFYGEETDYFSFGRIEGVNKLRFYRSGDADDYISTDIDADGIKTNSLTVTAIKNNQDRDVVRFGRTSKTPQNVTANYQITVLNNRNVDGSYNVVFSTKLTSKTGNPAPPSTITVDVYYEVLRVDGFKYYPAKISLSAPTAVGQTVETSINSDEVIYFNDSRGDSIEFERTFVIDPGYVDVVGVYGGIVPLIRPDVEETLQDCPLGTNANPWSKIYGKEIYIERDGGWHTIATIISNLEEKIKSLEDKLSRLEGVGGVT